MIYMYCINTFKDHMIFSSYCSNWHQIDLHWTSYNSYIKQTRLRPDYSPDFTEEENWCGGINGGNLASMRSRSAWKLQLLKCRIHQSLLMGNVNTTPGTLLNWNHLTRKRNLIWGELSQRSGSQMRKRKDAELWCVVKMISWWNNEL